MRKPIRTILYSALLLILIAAAVIAVGLFASLPKLDGEVGLAGLTKSVEVTADSLAIPTVKAASRTDAVRALGWLHARDRLFQMELMRRKSAGQLAELFGPPALALDQRQRALAFEPAARDIVAAMPPPHREILAAYVAGVNAFIQQTTVLPPEFLALRLLPKPWREEDTLLVALGMFQTLNGEENGERMLTVMEKALPDSLLRFLTPDTDEYATVLVGGAQSRRPALPIPVKDWAALKPAQVSAGGVDALSIIAGSNNWAVAGTKTRDGRAIVANDMHLTLGIPNIWYRAELRYQGLQMSGVTLPGIPLLIVGSNGHVAWGFTNVDADVIDLVRLEINPANPDEYRTPQGWRAFERRVETIQVKGEADQTIELKRTIWGPLSPKPLLGQAVAVHWTALQADGVNFGLLDMDLAATVQQALSVANHFAGPAQNIALADRQGHIGWSLLGRYPKRRGFDGLTSQSWADGRIGWEGWIAPEALPRLIDPPSGYFATANNRTLGSDYPHLLAHNQANGYRAYRISQRLAELKPASANEQDLLAIQLDTRSEFFEYYRNLALAALKDEAGNKAELDEIRRYIGAWDGQMNADSLGIGLLWSWREKLAAAVFAPVVARCRQVEPDFAYSWREMETPLRSLLNQQLAPTLPDSRYKDWPDLLRQTLAETARELKQDQQVEALDGLSWGQINQVPIRHPFSKAMPWLSAALDMPKAKLSGCAGFCVRITGNGHGASERMVVSPGHAEQGILHMPGGQSGHPLSANYRDQQAAWNNGQPLPFLPGPTEHRLLMTPGE